MNFYQIRQTMTDDAYDVIFAFGQTASLTLQAIAYITGQNHLNVQAGPGITRGG